MLWRKWTHLGQVCQVFIYCLLAPNSPDLALPCHTEEGTLQTPLSFASLTHSGPTRLEEEDGLFLLSPLVWHGSQQHSPPWQLSAPVARRGGPPVS